MALEQAIFKIVAVGPESSGKTTLAGQLAEALRAPCVPEFARSYLGHLGRPYVYEDLPAIAGGQKAWEEWYARLARPYLVCDTDWTVIRIWEAYKYGSALFTTPPPPPASLYLLCSPDFDWQPDPLREHPEERWALFDHYRELLQTTGAPFHLLSGAPDHRLQTALALIRNYY